MEGGDEEEIVVSNTTEEPFYDCLDPLEQMGDRDGDNEDKDEKDEKVGG